MTSELQYFLIVKVAPRSCPETRFFNIAAWGTFHKHFFFETLFSWMLGAGIELTWIFFCCLKAVRYISRVLVSCFHCWNLSLKVSSSIIECLDFHVMNHDPPVFSSFEDVFSTVRYSPFDLSFLISSARSYLSSWWISFLVITSSWLTKIHCSHCKLVLACHHVLSIAATEQWARYSMRCYVFLGMLHLNDIDLERTHNAWHFYALKQ